MRSPHRSRLLLAVAVPVALAACSQARAPQTPASGSDGGADAALAACTRCHGDPTSGNAAPPRAVNGATATSAVGVGAHQRHLTAGAFARAIACSECHVVPATVDAPGHVDRDRADLTWGPLASAGGVAPAVSRSADGTTLTCTVYCHGASLTGGSVVAPSWTQVDGTQAACGTCHGIPPPAPHPAVAGGTTGCAACHPATVRPDGSLDVAGGHHVDGQLDLAGGGGGTGSGCTACHGDPGRADATAPAPPRDTRGATTSEAVGAHLAHLRPGALSAAIACSECHVVPTSPAHSDGTVQVAFGALARTVLPGDTRTVAPAFDATTLRCGATYCHGNFRNGNAGNAPQWSAGAAAVGCTSCHGSPPGGSHPAASDCGACHPGYGPGTVNAATHVDGKIDVAAQTCTSCHGDATRGGTAAAAPPRDARGATASDAVGAHQAHLQPGRLSGPIACAECHVVPTSTSHSDGKVDVAFGTLARTVLPGDVQLGAPTFDPVTLRCGATYCHGAFGGGAAANAPAWNAGSAGAACGSCHGLPPGGAHPASADCGSCHPGYSGSTVNPLTHVDGKVDTGALTCTSCHGDAGRAAVAGADPAQASAPPRDTRGNSTASARGVGAHLAHVDHDPATALSRPVACAACHGAVPTSMAHANGQVTIAFSGLATAGGAAPAWNGTTLSCSATYCHGQFQGGAGPSAAPAWTTPGQLGCSSCHGSPPPPATGHVQRTDCGSCHPGYTATAVNVATHVDGKVDVVTLTCTTCHGTTGRTGADPAIAAAPPLGTGGETSTATRAVGAHLAHLQGGAVRGPVACAECHGVPTQQAHANGTVAVAFGALARAGGATPAWNGTSCASTYCHGATLGAGGALQTPAWTRVDGTQAACGTCHGLPPPTTSGHPSVQGGLTACNACHPATVRPDGTIDLAGGHHIDGAVDVVGQSCTSCHGDANRTAVIGADANVRAAPPVGTHGETATTTRAVGAHQAHVNRSTGALAPPTACGECHVVPASTSGHPTGQVNVTFGALARTGGASPSWNGTGCAATYCHGQFKGGTAATPAWTASGPLGCGACHGNPPAGSTGHPQNASCGACHPGYGAGTVNAATHVNGQVEVVSMTCTSCHGTAGRTGPDPYVAAAPPVGTRGETATTDRAVGAHLTHLRDGAVRAAVACAECHSLPAQQLHADGTVQVAFGTLARTGGAAPAWNGSTCGSTYCHGATLAAGGTLQTPTWTRVDGSQAACGTCHGVPPPTSAGHPSVSGSGTAACNACHPATVKADGTIDVAGGKHIDGVLQVANASCTTCHGDAARTPAAIAPAPPAGTHGETATTTRAVGAHQAHLVAGHVAGPVACGECHVVPSSSSHSDGTVQVTFGTLARSGGAAPAWNGTTCASTYCHGATLAAGGTATAPTWTTVDGSQRQCTSCHGAPPPTSSGHPSVGSALTGCAGCHPATVKADGTLDLAGGKHLNGTLEVTGGSCTSCHGDATRAAAIAPAPPVDTAGNTATTAPGVGAHQRHLTGGSIRAAVACSDCHLVPSDSAHAAQPLDLTWGALARAGGVTPSWNGTSFTCTNYCHGITLPGGSDTTPIWTKVDGTQAACGTCHGLPPPVASQHPPASSATSGCNACHPATVTSSGTIDLAGGHHVDGNLDVDYTRMTCTSCHGDATRTPVSGADANVRAAPPAGTRGETSTATKAVGAHVAHVNRGTFARPVACAQCHTVPTTNGHANGTVNVAWGTLARTGGASPSWNGASCSATYCHGSFTGGASAAPSWTGGTLSCSSCHAVPPGTGRHSLHASGRASCTDCHGTGYSTTTVRVTSHVDGVKDVGGSGSRINAWNASTRTCSPACHSSQTW